GPARRPRARVARGGQSERPQSENEEKSILMNTNEDYAKFSSPSELRIVRTLPGPIERVWDYLTDPEKRARWFCGGQLEQRAGGKVVFHMVHKNLAPNEKPP